MADPITIGFGAAGLFVASVTAVANMASAYSQYRANHPHKNKTGRVDNYTADHNGYSLTQHQGYPRDPREDPFFTHYAYMVQVPLPELHSSYEQFYGQPSVAGYVDPYMAAAHQVPRSASYAQQPEKSPSFTQQYFPVSSSVLNRVLRRKGGPHPEHARSSSAPPVQTQYIPPGPQQQVPCSHHVPRTNSAPPAPTHRLAAGFGGTLVLEKEQRSRDTLRDTKVGMHTGRMPGYNKDMAKAHWSLFYPTSLAVVKTIAVVNWSERVITIYVHSPQYDQYFRNYHVEHADLEAFGSSFHRNEVFTGILKDSWLVGCNDDKMKLVEDDGDCSVKSSNCWSMLGIQGYIRGDLVFVEIKRAALFGLLQCRSQDPTLLNVDMVGDKRVQFVHVDSDFRDLDTKGNCWFSVFSFNTGGWAEERVLVG